MEAFLHGIFLAFGLILPLGVQNLFVFNQGATQPSIMRTLPVVITASICDTLLILLAVLGVSLVIFTFQWLKVGLVYLGFTFLLYMGWITWNTSGDNVEQEQEKFSPQKQIIFAASVSLLNPHAIMDTIGVIGMSSLNYWGGEKWLFTGACILVSWCWFLGLALTGRWLGNLNRGKKFLTYLNKFSALIIWGAAFYLLMGSN